jgi:hypothetical protein
MSSGSEHEPSPHREQLRRNEWDAHAEVRARIAEGFACFDPEPFQEFLQLPEVELNDPKLLERFVVRHIGSFDSMVEATAGYLEHVGWVTATGMFLTSATTQEGRPKWDWIRATRSFKAACHVIERGGRIHVFTK